MPEVLEPSSVHAEPEKEAPDYFGYYIREIRELLSQKDEFLSSLFPQNSLPSPSSKYGKPTLNNMDIHHSNGNQTSSSTGSSLLFSNGVGDGLSDCNKERLKASLKQSVTVLSREVDEMLEPILTMYRIKKHLREKECLLTNPDAAVGEVNQTSYKKQKLSSPYSSTNVHLCGGFQFVDELQEDLRTLLDEGGPQAKKVVKKQSDELSEKLKQMDEQLEEFLDIVMSKSRRMSPAEKRQLQKHIQELPPRNLQRVVEIVQRRNLQEEHPSNEIHIDLEKEDNITLWRLYFYMEAVASAKKLACR